MFCAKFKHDIYLDHMKTHVTSPDLRRLISESWTVGTCSSSGVTSPVLLQNPKRDAENNSYENCCATLQWQRPIKQNNSHQHKTPQHLHRVRLILICILNFAGTCSNIICIWSGLRFVPTGQYFCILMDHFCMFYLISPKHEYLMLKTPITLIFSNLTSLLHKCYDDAG